MTPARAQPPAVAVVRELGVEVAYLRGAEEVLAELWVLADYDDDLGGLSIRMTNRLRDALLHVHPETHRGRRAVTAALRPQTGPGLGPERSD